jgi:ubiquinone biosynthesis protein
MSVTYDPLQAAVAGFLSGHTTSAQRVRAVEMALRSRAGRMLREQLGDWVTAMLPAELVVPEVYAAWRPLVRDAMLYTVSRLSAARLAPKLIEQIELPADTPPAKRLLRLIAKVPGLQKIGQVLARNRHLDPSLREALTELENGIHDAGAEEIRALVVRELGSRLDAYRVELETQLMCEASVSAVIRFTWTDPATGRRERGVFKALKPYVPECFREDMALLQGLAEFLAEKHPQYGSPLPETLTGVRHLLEREVDYRGEQATLAEAQRVYAKLPKVRVPQVIRALSTSCITAMREERGIKVTEVHQPRAAAQLIETLIAAPLLSREREVIFHADPHAGNLLYDEGTQELVVLDWALTERLTRAQRRHAAMLGMLVALRDAAGVCAEVEALSIDRMARHPALARFVREYVARFIDEIPLTRLPGSLDAMRLLDGLALGGVRFPAALLMFRKALFTLDGILHDMGTDVNMDAVLARYAAARWLRHWPSLGAPLSPIDWIAVPTGVLLLAARLAVRWAQDAVTVSPAGHTATQERHS